ncbi:DUF6777 domain-containing protein [Streptomyces sp. S.PNR 29]|uniref:DUF6777 domain-containing protein n=1 Tax=Streptomyces sp. S.PNR 29 TaxID=2973805 RepID=UPI00339D8E48
MRRSTAPSIAVCALAAALLLAGCGGSTHGGRRAGGELVLQPVADQGPDPFTDSTATSTATPPPATRTQQSAPAAGESAALSVLRSLSGGTPGLYGGTERVGSCDVERQIGQLTADRRKARAFARVAGVSPDSLPDHLRALTPVVLRNDTRVTNHAFRDGRATGYQSVLQAGTAVLVDNRGVPRVRCACGNPLKPPVETKDDGGTRGRPWPGYRPGEVIVVTPAPEVITSLTIVNAVNKNWIERRTGHDAHHDYVVPPPVWATGSLS